MKQKDRWTNGHTVLPVIDEHLGKRERERQKDKQTKRCAFQTWSRFSCQQQILPFLSLSLSFSLFLSLFISRSLSLSRTIPASLFLSLSLSHIHTAVMLYWIISPIAHTTSVLVFTLCVGELARERERERERVCVFILSFLLKPPAASYSYVVSEMY